MLSYSVGIRVPSIGHAARCLAGPRQLDALQHWSYRAWPPLNRSIMGVLDKMTLSHHATTRVAAYAVDPAGTNSAFHLLYDGITGVALSDEPQLFAVNLVRSHGSPALTGHYFVDILPQSDFR